MDEHEKIEGLEEERKSEFHQFIGLYKNWFKPENIQQFLDYYKYVESIKATSNRRQSEDANFLAKADNAISIGYYHGHPTNELWADHSFHPFLKYINGSLLENYNMMFPGFGRPQSLSCKIQKTLPGEGYHIWHCEHASRDTGQRCILAMAYLNTVAEGGETEFLYQSRRVPAVQGNIMFCPAGYTHTHRGNPPLTGDKYCITTWLEFTH